MNQSRFAILLKIWFLEHVSEVFFFLYFHSDLTLISSFHFLNTIRPNLSLDQERIL